MTCELVCTGWYSTDTPRSYITYGDEHIRNKNFRPLWWQSLDSFVKPQHVLIIDSASPVKSEDNLFTKTKVQYIELLRNPGHSQNCLTHYCGAMAAIIIGMEFALHNDVDYFLYIEQDALIYGNDFVKKIKERLKFNDMIFGSGGQFGEVQQSVFAVNKKGIRRFLSAIHDINQSDHQISPEMKFMYAASGLRYFPFSGLLSYDNPQLMRRSASKLFLMLMTLMNQYDYLPFGYGRLRPINFKDSCFYFQHASSEEIAAYRNLTGF
jgi:hypothetical protein